MTNEKLYLTENLTKALNGEIIDRNELLIELETILKDGLILKDITRDKSALTLCFYNGQKFEVSVKQI